MNVNTDKQFKISGLYDVDFTKYSLQNLIIGKNGSGKTRFLKALEQEKLLKKKDTVVTLYFPEINAFFNTAHKQPYPEDADYFTVDLLTQDAKLNFGDFLKQAESDNGEFLVSLLKMQLIVNSRAAQKAKKALNNLNQLMADFLEKEIVVDSEQNSINIKRLNTEDQRCKPFQESLMEFSPGELMLFYLCIFLTVIGNETTGKIILIMDEPEAHLHPKTLVKLIQTLKESSKIGELWVASHSLFLVPLFTFREIIFLDHDHVIKHDSMLYKELYESLVGLENIDIFEFLKSIDNWQYYKFIAECFSHPTTVGEANPNDPQFVKLMESISLLQSEKTLKLLDFGAGEFRIWECLNLIGKTELDSNKISYTAYEPYPKTTVDLSFKLYTNFKDIKKAGEKFDVVILMNVLHEIEAKKWEKTFKDIFAILEDNGIVVFLEVHSLNNGEQPYGNNGYLLLQDEQVRILFNNHRILNGPSSLSPKTNCWIIPKEDVKNVTNDTISKSIGALFDWCDKKLREVYKERIETAHSEKNSSAIKQTARQYAFLSQQYLNAKFALDDLNFHPAKVASNQEVSCVNGRIVVRKVRE